MMKKVALALVAVMLVSGCAHVGTRCECGCENGAKCTCSDCGAKKNCGCTKCSEAKNCDCGCKSTKKCGCGK